MSIICVLFALASAQEALLDGDTKENEAYVGGNVTYSYAITSTAEDVKLILTLFTDSAIASLYASIGSVPTTEEHQWAGTYSKYPELTIPASSLETNQTLYISVNCLELCTFYLSLTQEAPIQFPSRLELFKLLPADEEIVYYHEPKGSELLQVHTVYGESQVSVSTSPEFAEMLETEEIWVNTRTVEILEPVYVKVLALEATKIGILSSPGDSVIRPSTPRVDRLDLAEAKTYYYPVGSFEEDFTLYLTLFSGNVTVYIKTATLPTTSDYDIKVNIDRQATYTVSVDALGDKTEKWVMYLVYGEAQSHFTFTVSEESEAQVELIPGIPHVGTVEPMQLREYDILILDNTRYQEFEFHLTPMTGAVALYIMQCMGPCHFDPSDIVEPLPPEVYEMTYSHGPEPLVIAYQANECAEDCRLVAAVVSKVPAASTYTLLFATENTQELVLQEAVPFSLGIGSGQSRHFEFTVSDPTVSGIEFVLSIISGDADLYQSTSGIPTTEEYDIKANHTLLGTPSVWISGAQVQGTHHLTVHSLSSALVSIAALPQRNNELVPLQLSPGFPVIYTATEDRNEAFFYLPRPAVGGLRLLVTPISGRFSLYLSKDEYPFAFEWMDQPDSSDPENVINLSEASLGDAQSFVAKVAVTRFDHLGTASFAIHYEVTESVVTLLDEVAMSGQVELGQYQYYAFTLQSARKDVQVVLQTIAGNADLYISVDHEDPLPVQGNSDYKSAGFGIEIVTLTWSGMLENHCPEEELLEDYSDHCIVTIGVYGHLSSAYFIHVVTISDTPVSLALSQSHGGSLEAEQFSYYYVSVDANLIASIKLTETNAVIGLFATLLDSSEAGSDPTEWDMPSGSENEYAAEERVYSPHLEFTSATLLEQCPSGFCLILLAVECQSSHSCDYAITASQSVLTQILENEPQINTVPAGEYHYYEYFCNSNENTLVISVTPIGETDPDLYIMKGRETLPTVEEYHWESIHYGADLVAISPSDSFFDNGAEMSGTYVIAVYSVFLNSAYSITVNNHPASVVKLVDGMPVSGSLEPHSNAYYYYNHERWSDLTVRITPVHGSAVIVVSHTEYNEEEELSNIYESLPNATHYLWSSHRSGQKHEVTISQNDAAFCEGCQYIIGVITEDQECSYSITATNTEDAQFLQNGVPVLGAIDQGKSAYYLFSVSTNTNVNIVLNSYSGDSDLAVGLYETSEQSWRSNGVDLVDHIRISKSDPNFQVGDYEIEVKGYTAGTYSLVVYVEGSPVSLIDGWPLGDSTTNNEEDFVFYKFSRSEEGDHVYCTLKPLSTLFRPTVYMKYFNASAVLEVPNEDNANEKYALEEYHSIYDTLEFTVVLEGDKNHFGLAVYPHFIDTVDADVALPGQFELQCSSSSKITVLKSGSSKMVTIPEGSSVARFQLDFNQTGWMLFTVTSCSKHLEIALNSDWTTSTTSDQGILEIVKDEYTKQITTLVRQAGTRYLTVTAKNPNTPTHFELQASFIPDVFHEPYEEVLPGNDGALKLTVTDGKASVSWDALTWHNKTQFAGDVIYKVVAATETESELKNTCQITNSLKAKQSEMVVKAVNIETASFAVHDDGLLIVNVMATFQAYGRTQYVSYEPVEFSVQLSAVKTHYTIIILIGAAVLAGVVLIAVFLYCKCRKVEKELAYEKGDVRKLAEGVPVGGTEGLAQMEPAYEMR